MAHIDRKRLIGEMASRYGIRLDDNDPALAIISLNQLVLEETIHGICEQLRTRIAEFETSAQKMEIRAGTVLAQQVKESAADLRRELHADVHAASLKSRELLHQIHEAHRRPVLLRWAAIGVICGFILFLCGVWVGRIAALGWGRAWL
jgi:hypothetical protein